MLSLFNEQITVRRFRAGGYVGGRHRGGAEREFTLSASVQPMTAFENVQEFGGRRVDGDYVVFTKEPLMTTNEIEKTRADRIVWQGQEYEVKLVQDWQNLRLRHYESIVKRVD